MSDCFCGPVVQVRYELGVNSIHFRLKNSQRRYIPDNVSHSAVQLFVNTAL